MARFSNQLNNVRVASPCNVDWEQMVGDERTRFCSQCNLNVYNLSSMTRSEAEHLIASNEGRLCVRYYRRADGSILTKDCPIGLRALKRKLSYASKAIASAALSFLAGIGVYQVVGDFVDERPFARREVMGVMVPRPEVRQATLPPLSPPSVTMGGVRMGQLVQVKPVRKDQRTKK